MGMNRKFDGVWRRIVALMRETEPLERRDRRWSTVNNRLNAAQFHIWEAFLCEDR